MIGGGELIRENQIFLNHPNWDKEITVPKVIFGCGVNSPNQRIRSEVLNSLKDWRYIGLRDHTSYHKLFPHPNIHLCLDPSIILSEKHYFKWNMPESNCATIIPTDRRSRKYDPGIESTSIIKDSFPELQQSLIRERFDRIFILAFGGDDNDDDCTAWNLRRELGQYHVSMLHPRTAVESMRVMVNCRKAYTYRLHGLIFAWMLKMPFHAFNYHSKIHRVSGTLASFTVEEAIENLKENAKLVHEIS